MKVGDVVCWLPCGLDGCTPSPGTHVDYKTARMQPYVRSPDFIVGVVVTMHDNEDIPVLIRDGRGIEHDPSISCNCIFVASPATAEHFRSYYGAPS